MIKLIKQTKDEQNIYYHSFNDEPAIVYSNGTKFWYHHGEVHRENGPAVVYSDGTKFWFIHGSKYTLHEWLKLSSLSEEEKTELVLSHDYS